MIRTLLLAVSIVALCSSAPHSTAVDGTPECLPVEAPVVDGFRLPPEPWQAGNRGLTFDTSSGQPVRAVASGTVHFAGAIAGERYVSVDRPDGTRVTYSYLGSVAVAAGDAIDPGVVVGTAGLRPFQLGWREGPEYRDPTPLVGGACPARHAILVPVPPG
jgi:murein DD-endopeptidase MepM/ murein hydrolase activator NlpD